MLSKLYELEELFQEEDKSLYLIGKESLKRNISDAALIPVSALIVRKIKGRPRKDKTFPHW
jgi:hypothetical protein